eukprot:gene18915-22106_t
MPVKEPDTALNYRHVRRAAGERNWRRRARQVMQRAEIGGLAREPLATHASVAPWGDWGD